MSTRCTHQYGEAYSQSAALVQDSRLFPRIRKIDFDLATFMTIVQSIPDARILPLTPRFRKKNSKYGASGQVCLPRTKLKKKGVAFKRFHGIPEEVFQAAACEVIVLEHPAFKDHPHIVKLLGVTFDVHADHRVLPCLALEHSKQGALSSFLHDGVSIYQRLMFCFHVGSAIKALHQCNIVHGDVKPHNVLVFPCDVNETTFVAKIIDFGASCFGSAEHNTVTLGYTDGWKAPEIERAGQQFTLEHAKKTDVFSYGKLCKWILHDSDHRESLNGHSRNSRSSRYQRELDTFFENSCHESPEKRDGIEKLMSRLTGVIKHYRKTSEGRNEHPLMGKSAVLSGSRLPAIRDIRRTFGRVLGVMVSDKSSEFYAHGQIHVRLLQRRVQRVLTISWVCLMVFALTIFIVVGYVSFEVKRKKQSGDAVSLLFMSFAILAMMVTIWTIIYLVSTPHGWADLRVVFRPVAVYGQRKHMVPHLPTLAPVLNQLHHYVREELVAGLQKRLRWRCKDCRRLAHIELAWANHIAFGMAQNLDKAGELMDWGEHPKSYLRQLCSEANFWDFGYQIRYGLNKEWEAHKYDQRTARELVSTFINDDIETAISAVQAELNGKMALRTTIYSQMSLASTLASLHHEARDLEKAEIFYRMILTLEKEAERRATRVAPFLRLYYATDPDNVVNILAKQGKIDEAISELRQNTSALRNPNGKTSFWKQLLKVSRLYEDRRDIPRRQALVTLYLQKKDMQALTKLDLHKDLLDLKARKTIKRSFRETSYRLLGEYAQLRASQGEVNQAALMLERRMVHRDDILEDDASRDRDRREDALVFSLSTTHLNAAIAIQERLLENAASQALSAREILALRMEYAFSLAQRGDVNEALNICREVSELTVVALGSDPFMWNCLMGMTGSICSHNPGEMSKPNSLQVQLLEECSISEDVPLKRDVLSILCLTARQDGCEMVTQRLRNLLSSAASYSSSASRIIYLVQSMLVFVLSCRGLAHECSYDLAEACNIAEEILNHFSTRGGKTKLQSHVTIASIYQIANLAYLNRLRFLCSYQGFGSDDVGFFKEAISRHRTATKVMEEVYGDFHPHTEYAWEQLANALSLSGSAMQNGAELVEAEVLLAGVLRWKTEKDSESSQVGISATTIPIEVTVARLTRLRLESGEATMKENRRRNKAVQALYKKSWRYDHSPRLAVYLEYPALSKKGELTESCAENMFDAIDAVIDSRENLPDDPEHHPDIFRSWAMLSKLRTKSPDIPLLRETVTAATLFHLQDRGLTHPVTIKYQSMLANALSKNEATRLTGIQLCKIVLQLEQAEFGELHTRTISTRRRLAIMQLEAGLKDDALPSLRTALSNAIVFLGNTHTTTIRIYECLLKAETSQNPVVEQEVQRFLAANVRGRISKAKFHELSERLVLLVQGTQEGNQYQPFAAHMSEIIRHVLQYEYSIEEENASEICKGLQEVVSAALV